MSYRLNAFWHRCEFRFSSFFLFVRTKSRTARYTTTSDRKARAGHWSVVRVARPWRCRCGSRAAPNGRYRRVTTANHRYREPPRRVYRNRCRGRRRYRGCCVHTHTHAHVHAAATAAAAAAAVINANATKVPGETAVVLGIRVARVGERRAGRRGDGRIRRRLRDVVAAAAAVS